MTRLFGLLLVSGLAFAILTASVRSDDNRSLALLTIDGAIGPATSDYFTRGVTRAEQDGASLIVLLLDTPGGLVASTRDIIKSILGSGIPVVTYVSPSGSRAASAGTYILYASHVAAMAPATNLGAATPVSPGGGGPAMPEAPDSENNAGDEEDASQPDNSTAQERKGLNDMVAYIRSLAELRGRNVEWAEKAVREAVSLPANEAVEQNVIDLVADNLSDLLEKVNGRVVDVGGVDTTIDSSDLVIERIEPDWRTRLLATLTDPSVAYFLMLIGIYGLLFEGYNPGAIVPGVVGAICLLMALYAFQVLSVNYAGLGLILLGLILMVSEVFVPSFGALGIGGIVAFVIGSIILIDTDVPGFGVDRTLIGAVATVGGSFVMAIVWFAVRARMMPVVTGKQELIGALAEAKEDFDGAGTVFIHGESWSAQSSRPVRKGEKVRVVAMKGLQLEVENDSGGGNN
ncbi:MAG: nodulation protein NfeD [Gammaproteobacteria bacterium]|nr:nodulation protein NfeD [Gammaproteobacteria bacterium]